MARPGGPAGGVGAGAIERDPNTSNAAERGVRDGAMSLAENRPSRKNAGNRMSRLLEAEEDDDFYKTTYGGFHE
ncbi:hypothetical protein chiPu_0027976, partial [Chiloscyllium punctatum]|nr:hypothetical protein [Chiloscyllium punctatum]